MDEELNLLEREYCPPLDPALVYAIFLDFEPNGTDRLQRARELLDPIKQTAIAEQYTEFDPSGSSGQTTCLSPGKSSGSSEGEESRIETASQSAATDITSLSNDVFTLGLNQNSPSPEDPLEGGEYLIDVEQLDFAIKELRLSETFPTLRPSLVSFTLKKCNGNFGKTTDELLNHVYFADSTSSPGAEQAIAKGVDAFSEEHTVGSRGRKGKSKKRRNLDIQNARSVSLPATSSVQQRNRWHDTNRDVDLISSRTGVSHKNIASLYHKNGASVSATIMAMLEINIKANEHVEEDDPVVLQNAIDLISDFPSLELPHAFALIRLTHPSTASAHELAKVLIAQPDAKPLGKIEVIPRYAPINLSGSSPSPPSSGSATPSLTIPHTTAALGAARSAAFAQASAAYRKGKSEPLMKAAAGYYSQLGRDYDVALKAASSAEVDALVSSQSTPTQLDLHGVGVKDATRITRERVTAWWHGLGEGRVDLKGRSGIGEGYRIVTGMGRHSEGGISKLGPAVARMLVRDGWKVEVGSGVLIVTGVAKRK
ncbi:hypothetical protein AOQ84DRAFT_341246 [Glonium stellatum]|uniref:Smr domain-containing protein n=1 Tax=Glonium stellatum TaxID=574774 RepID=A0A8E2JSG7_9PEZI|nr:hypothetical protein AOQ84DRAFT_341246 [Glonium stellatum]